jgi:hypothetical protein
VDCDVDKDGYLDIRFDVHMQKDSNSYYLSNAPKSELYKLKTH